MRRTKRKNIVFTESQWDKVCKRAKFLEMKPAPFIRNMAVYEVWKIYSVETVCSQIKRINHIGTDLNMILKVAEKTNSEHLERLRELQKRYDRCRQIFYKHYSQLLNVY